MLGEIGEVGAGWEHELSSVGSKLAPRLHFLISHSVRCPGSQETSYGDLAWRENLCEGCHSGSIGKGIKDNSIGKVNGCFCCCGPCRLAEGEDPGPCSHVG